VRRLAGDVAASRRVWLTLALGLLLIGLASSYWSRPEPLGLDFHTYAAAAKVGLDHGWSHLYDQQLVARAQAALVPSQVTQPFLSPPPVAWLVAVLAPLPYAMALVTWAVVTIGALVLAVVWSAPRTGVERWLAAAFVVAPAWVLTANRVGQVVPLVAVGILLAWRWLREDREAAAGLVLTLILLKPNTAFLVPLALLVAGRQKLVVTWLLGAAVLALAVFTTVGVDGISAYLNQLQHPPSGTDALSLEAAFGVSGPAALVLRLAVVGIVLAAAWAYRASPGLAIVAGVIGSLLITPYLHASDLTLLVAAGWIVWNERPTYMWRIPLAASWLVANPFITSHLRLTQNRWPVLEMIWLLALVIVAWRFDVRGRTLSPAQELEPVTAEVDSQITA
jgi:hypothetical protein